VLLCLSVSLYELFVTVPVLVQPWALCCLSVCLVVVCLPSTFVEFLPFGDWAVVVIPCSAFLLVLTAGL
jgi:hypothetical protein